MLAPTGAPYVIKLHWSKRWHQLSTLSFGPIHKCHNSHSELLQWSLQQLEFATTFKEGKGRKMRLIKGTWLIMSGGGECHGWETPERNVWSAVSEKDTRPSQISYILLYSPVSKKDTYESQICICKPLPASVFSYMCICIYM